MSVQHPDNFHKCAQCSFPMRPRGALKADFPGTHAWGSSGKCKSCVQPNNNKTTAKSPKETTSTMPQTTNEFGYDDEDLTGFHEEDPGYRQRAVPPEVRLANTVSGLDAFMARRHQRVQAEAIDPIVWGRENKAA